MAVKGKTNNPLGINQYEDNRSKKSIGIRLRRDIEQRLRDKAQAEGKTFTQVLEETILVAWEMEKSA